MSLNKMYFISLILIFLQLFYLQIKKLNIKSSKECLKIFKSNNYLGFFVFIALLVGKT